MKMNEKEIQDMLQAYPELEYMHIDETKKDIFQGTIFINHVEEKTKVHLVGKFGIKIVVDQYYPEKLPVVYDTNNSIDKDYIHRYPDGELCLESITRLKLFSRKHSVKEFIDLFLINYLCSYLYFERYLTYPNGERPHGFIGEYDFLKEFFDVSIEQVVAILKYMLDNGIKRNDLCPCGSGRKIKRCHGKQMIEIQNCIKKSGVEKIILDLFRYLKEKRN